MDQYDLIIIGGGIVGIATAWKLQERLPDASILLVDKEAQIAHHQTGHNSGVIHAGVYYQPGSLKADFCRRGAQATFAFCQEFDIPFEQCGKLLVATEESEYERMTALEARCAENKIDVERLNEVELINQEPSIRGVGALYVPATGITDYRLVTREMANCFTRLGGEIRLKCEVLGINEQSDKVALNLENDIVQAEHLVVCGGLMADRLAKMMHIDIDFNIIPFRGEYYKLGKEHNAIVKHLIYPIPDPELPFLGVHLTRMIDGSVTVGPNAVLGWKREGYGRFNFKVSDVAQMLGFPGFWRVLKDNLRSGLAEMRDSLYKTGYLQRVQKYCPELTRSDLKPYPAGIRAQAVLNDGSLVHDFLFAHTERSLHVCNAPSPAATSAQPIGEHLCQKAIEQFSL